MHYLYCANFSNLNSKDPNKTQAKMNILQNVLCKFDIKFWKNDEKNTSKPAKFKKNTITTLLSHVNLILNFERVMRKTLQS